MQPAGAGMGLESCPVRILHISDLHVEPTPERRQPGLMAGLQRDRAQLLAVGADFTIVSGDLTTYGCAEPDHFTPAKQWLDGLGLPYLAVAGNHDLGANAEMGRADPAMSAYEDVPHAETGYGLAFGADPVVTRDLDTVRIVGASLREDDPDGVLPRLDELFGLDDRPVIAVTHYPIAEPREPLIHPMFGSSAFVPKTIAALGELIERHQNVRVYLAGHIHVSTARPLGTHCTQLTVGSIGQGASAFRVYDVDETGLTYSTVLGSGPLAFWSVPEPEFHLGDPAERTGRIDW